VQLLSAAVDQLDAVAIRVAHDVEHTAALRLAVGSDKQVMRSSSQVVPESYRKVLRFVRRRVDSADDAEDLTQEVFANAAASLGSVEGDSPALAWLYTVAKRRIADEARRRARSEAVSLELVPEPPASPTYGDEVSRVLDSGLATMPEGQRRVVVGRLLQGRSFAELSRDLGATEEACRMRFMRGLQHLREEFTREGLNP
jgi:RNA polymerase sigma factor (sigma-70 family)